MRFLDSHAHLADPAFNSDRSEVIARARAAGAVAVVAIGESLAAAARARELAALHPGFVYFTAGCAIRDLPRHRSTLADPAAIRAEVSKAHSDLGEVCTAWTITFSTSPLTARAAASRLPAGLAIAQAARPTGGGGGAHAQEPRKTPRPWCAGRVKAGIRGVIADLCTGESFTRPRCALESGWYHFVQRHRDHSEVGRRRPGAPGTPTTGCSWDPAYFVSRARCQPGGSRPKRNEPAWVARTVERVAIARGVPVDQLGEQCVRNAVTFFGLPSSTFNLSSGSPK